MQRSKTLLRNGIPLRNGRGKQLLWRSKSPVWDRKPRNKGNLIMPGVQSTLPEFVSLLIGTADDCNRNLKFEPTEEGFAGPNGISGSFSKIKTVSGIYMKPFTYLPVSNEKIVDELKLPKQFLRDRDAMIFESLAVEMFSTAEETPLRIPKMSSSTFPFFTNEDADKLMIAEYVIRNHDAIIKLIAKRDMEALAKEHGVVIAYMMNIRGQADAPEKKRPVNDYLYALSGGKEGSRFDADKTVFINGNIIPGVSAMRARTVCGMSFSVNLLMNMFLYPIVKSYQHKFAFTWHHGRLEEKEADLNRFKFALDLDVTSFDQTVQMWQIDKLWDTLQNKGLISTEMAELIKMAHRAPYFQPSVDGEQPGRWLGNPLDGESFNLEPGLLSGIATVSPFGKFAMMFAYLCWIDNITNDVLEFGVAKILSGQHPSYGFKNQGDDCRLLFNDESLRERLLTLARTEGACYFSFDIEEGGSFVGDVVIRDSDTGMLKLVPSAISYLEKWLVAERGIDSRFRPMWHLGYYERKTLFGRNPSYQEVEEILQFHWKKNFPTFPTMNALVDRYVDQHMRYGINFSVNSYADLQIINDPNKMHYAVDLDEVSPEIRDTVVMSMPFDDYRKIFTRHFGGKLQ